MFAWATAATRVVRPLVPVAGFARSSHDPDVPGLIEADLSRGPTQTVELIVHETAHLHLRAAQAAAALIDPCHQCTYRSPLRPEPRPLMGILLAYHALAYICAALQEASAAGILHAESAARAMDDLGRRRDDARATMEGASEHLTDAGTAFLARTHEVADFVIA
jgi:HEXXH motif-containing protein